MKFSLSTHVLELDSGQPAAGLQIALYRGDEATPLSRATTNDDGRVSEWPAIDALDCGRYQLEFAAADWYQGRGHSSFYPRVRVEFLADEARHYHVPLLMNRFGYSTYRGS